MRDHDGWRHLLDDLPLPAAVLDLDALDRNLDALLTRLDPRVGVRLATRELPLPRILRYLGDRAGDRLRGLEVRAAHEAAWLADQGFDDLLLGRPIGRPDEAAALARAARTATVHAAVDHLDQARLLSAAAEGAGAVLRLCLDVDVAGRPGGPGRRDLQPPGRSRLCSTQAAVDLATACRGLPGVVVDGVLTRASPSADDAPERASLLALPQRLAAQRAAAAAARRRRELVDALRAAGVRPVLVHGVPHDGGEPCVVTEVGAGATLARGDGTPPSLFVALGVVRLADDGHLSCAADPDLVGVVQAPPGLTPVGSGPDEAWFRVDGGGPALRLGDVVVCRAPPARVGARFRHVHLVRGDRVIEAAETPRGAGQPFP